jgi:uncharacterized repeat protein (TIGR01451 family)
MKRNFTTSVLVSCTLLMLGSLMYASKTGFDPVGAITAMGKTKRVEKAVYKETASRAVTKPAKAVNADMVCSLVITQVSVSECRNDASTGNIPTALVAVSVAWLDPLPGEDIIITFDGGPTVTLDPAEDGCPAYGQFEVNLNTASPAGLISAAFSGGLCTAVDVPYTLPAPCATVGPCGAAGTMGGEVYSDFDSDGAKDASEFGLPGVQVDIFDCDQTLLCSTNTDVNGNWRCTGLPNGTRVRVEFSNTVSSLNNAQAGPDNNGGSVQFAVVGSDCTVDFGLSDPAIYCENNPYVITNCYVRGNPLLGGTAGTADVVLAVPYSASGTISQNIYLAEGFEVGATWGIALNRRTKNAFASSLLKRHIGWGPDSLSAIYKIDVSTLPPPSNTGNSSLYVDLDDQFGIEAADEYLMPRDLSGNVGDPSYDPAVFDRVGKEGLGDMDISADADSIFVVNLKNKTIVIIENNPVTDVPVSAVEVAIPDPGCADADDWRPWALKYQDGRVYVGGVCSAQSTQNEDDMTATIYSFDPQTGIFTTLITFDLDYPKGSPASFLPNPSADCKNWNPWTDDFLDLIESGIELCYPQPILSDIEFDVYGNMTIAFIDRMGHQAGWFDYGTSAGQTGTNVYKGNVGGEVLRIYNNNGHYLLEKNAVAGFDDGCGNNNGQGPCGGEFYCQDAFGGSHQETAHGGLAIHPSNNEVLLNVMDPLGAFSAGLAWYNNSTGLSTRQYQIYFSGNNGTTGLFGKAAGLGDLELVCGTPSQEIGNHVFIDLNRNGIQDGCDIPLQGVNVTLFNSSGTQVATTTTNADGYYYFDTSDGVVPQTDYYIVFGKSGQWGGTQLTIAGNSYTLTSANIGTGAAPDINDSDASIAPGVGVPASVAGFPAIFVTSGAEGQSTHTYDMGLLYSVSIGSTVFYDTNDNGVYDEPSEDGITGVTLELFSAGPDNLVGGGDDFSVATDVTDANGDYFFGDLPEGFYYTKINTPPAAYPLSSTDIASSSADNQTDNDDNGLQPGGAGTQVMSPLISLIAGSEPTFATGETAQGSSQDGANNSGNDANGDMTVDFGFISPVSVGSTVFADLDNNGIYEPGDGEGGLPGVTLELYTVGSTPGVTTPVATTITDSNGDYLFDNLTPGSYFIYIPSAPSDYPLSSTPTDSADNQEDDDDNGTQASSGSPVISPNFTLTPNGEPTGAAESGSGGTQDAADDDNGDMTQDFGFVPNLSIGSTAWVDANNDGLYQEASENGVTGVTLELYNTGPDNIKGTGDDFSVDTDVTDGNGNYFFGNLLPGNYYVVIPASNFNSGGGLEAYQLSSTPTNPNDDQMDNDDNGAQMGGAGGVIMSPVIHLLGGTEPPVEPGSGGDQDDANDDNGDMTVDFGVIPAVSVGSNVFADNNNNGIDDGAGEPGIQGVTVELWSTGPDGIKGNADDLIAGTDVTDANGDYYIGGLPEGEYYLKIQPTQMAAGGPLEFYPLSSSDIATSASDNSTDNDDNGLQMGGAGGMVMSPEFTLTADAEPTTEPGSGGTLDDADDDNGDMTKDFGFTPAVSVGSTVFSDLDNNGIFEPQDGENGIPGVVVTLYSTGPDGVKGNGDDVLIGTEITDSNGDYLFDGLYQGEYYLAITTTEFGAGEPLNGYGSSTVTDTNDNGDDNDDNGIAMGFLGSTYSVMSPEFTLTPNTEPVAPAEGGQGSAQDDADDDNGDMTQDFGFVQLLSIASFVWVDDNNNGQFDPGELPVNGVRIILRSPGPDGLRNTGDDFEINTGPDGLLGTADDAAGGTLTDANGVYFFGYLYPGDYYLEVPASNFAAGNALAAYQLSSTPTNLSDDQVDNDDNGEQLAGAGTAILSPIINLQVGAEPTTEPGAGGNQDNSDDDNGDMTQDFGVIPAVSVGSQVFADLNNDGIFNGTDFGINGVEVQLWSTGPDGIKGNLDDVLINAGPDGVPNTADDAPAGVVTTTVSGQDGIYFFSGLPEGEYYLKIQSDQMSTGGALEYYPLSSADIASSATDNPTDNDDNGLQMGGAGGMVMSPEFTLDAGTEPTTEPGPGGTQDNTHPFVDANGDMTKDFGFTPAVSIGSTVFSDIDNDGLHEPQDGENGIPGVIVQVYSTGPNGTKENGGGDDVLVATDNTDPQGNYFVGGLYQGEYYVLITAGEFGVGEPLNGFVSSTPTDVNDNGQDEDDNGIAMGLVGTTYFVMSPEITLGADTEPVVNAEDGDGSTQDDYDDNNGDMTVDFGFVPSLSIGSTVWIDDQSGQNTTDNNGIQDAGENGLAGVTVQLFTAGPDGIKGNADDVEVNVGPDGILGTADDAAGGMLTNASGNYYFGNLLPDLYYIKIPVTNFANGGAAEAFPLSSDPTGENDDQMDGDDNGIQMGGLGGMIMSPLINLFAGTEPMGEPGQGGTQDDADDDNGDMTVDFGLIPGVSVGSNVFVDANNNGIDDGAGEPGISGVTIELWNTGPDGVKGNADDVLAGSDVTDANGDYFIGGLPEGEYYLKIQSDQMAAGGALEYYPLSSSDIATTATDNPTDNDDNGLQMGGAGGMVMSPEFTLTADSEPTTEPGSGGAQDDADDDNGDMTKDFGFVPALSVGSTVFADIDNDGLFEPQDGENGIPGVTLTLYSTGTDGIKGNGDDALIGTQITDANGDYFFGGLYPGEYYIAIEAAEFGSGEPLNGFVSSTPTDANDNGDDDDDNGIEMGLLGSTYMVMSPEFTLATDTEPLVNAEDGQGSDQDDFDDDNGDMTQDFGFVPVLAIGSTVFIDDLSGQNATDNNGIQDAGELGLAGVTVQLFDAGPDGVKGTADDVEIPAGPDGLLGTADDATGGMITNAGGFYRFGNLLPGVYYVKLPIGNFTAGGAAAAYPLSSEPTNENDDQMDSDDNGIQMGGSGGMIMSPLITLAAGTEPVGEPGTGGTLDDADDDNGDMTVDFGLIPAVSVGSNVFVDANNNGVDDGAGEAGIPGVTVELWHTGPDGIKGTADDQLVGSDVTDNNGDFFMGGLPEGEYYLKIQPDQLAAGGPLADYPLSSEDIATSASDNTTDADDNGLQMGGAGGMVMSPEFLLTANTEPTTEPGSGGTQDNADENNGDMTKDFGFTPAVSIGSTVFVDFDNNGLQDFNPVEVGIPGVTMELYDAGPDQLIGGGDDVLIATDVTDSNGDYFFGGLYEGKYYVLIPATQFGAGMSLASLPLSSVDTDANDNQEDFDDNGAQAGGQGTTVTSPVIMLMAGAEPTGTQEDAQGGTQDDADDNNGDMTVDFGFVPIQFDLALYKTLAVGEDATVEPGDTVTFTITVVNQGNLAAANIEIFDYIPAGFSFDASLNPVWNAVAGGATTTLPGVLDINQTTSIDIVLVVDAPLPAGTTLTNLAEISGATDEFGTPQPDVDSTPNDDPDDDTFLSDNEINGNGNNGGDEDDHDPAPVVVERFDLASIKLLAPGQSATVEPGDTVHYVIRVINQGDIAADNIELSDYVPTGMSYEGGITGNDNEGWSLSGSTVSRVLNIGDELAAGGLAPGASVEVDIFLTVNDPLPAGTSLRNFSEISDATDENGDDQVDDDSTPNDDPNDDVVNNDNDVSGDGNNGEDEDDHDYADVSVETFDLALMKLLATGQSASVEPGDTIHYRIRVINQGTIAADNILVTDYVPANMSYETGIAGNVNWTLSGGDVQRTLSVAGGDLPAGGLAPGDSVEVSLYLTLASPLAAGTQIDNYAEVSAATDENGDDQQDVDSTPDANDTNDVLTQDNNVDGNGNNGEDEDDHDVASVVTQRFDLASIKLLAPGQSATVEPGDTVHYLIRVINQGDIAADNIEVSDYVPTGMSYEGGITGNDNEGWLLSGSTVSRVLNQGDELAAGGLAPGVSVEVDIFLTVNDPLPAGTSLRNFSEISDATDENGDPQVDDDSTPNDDPDDDVVNNDNDVSGDGNNGEDEDDHDYADVSVETFDLALMKLLAPGQTLTVEPGDTVHYRIRVINQGTIAADNILVSDYVPAQMYFEGGITGNGGWTQVGALVQRTISVANGDLPAGGLQPTDSVEVDLYLTLNAPLPGGLSIDNFAEVTDATDENGDDQIDVDSTPDDNGTNDVLTQDNEVSGNGNDGEDEDDHDIATVITEVFDLALIKELGPNEDEFVSTGDTVLYFITVVNQGQIAADSIEITDHIPVGMILADADWTSIAGNKATRMLNAGDELPANGLQSGQNVTVAIRLYMQDELPAGTQLWNWAEISSAEDNEDNDQDDIDSEADGIVDNDNYFEDNEIEGDGLNGEDEDDHDPAVVTMNSFDLALYKTLAPGQEQLVEPGDLVTFRITVVNQGQIPAKNVLVYDSWDVDHFVLSDPDWTYLGPPPVVGTAFASLTITDTIYPGDSYIVDITMRVKDPLPANTVMVNLAEIGYAEDIEGNVPDDIDSDPDIDRENDTYLSDNEINGNGHVDGDEDDHDPAQLVVKTFDLALVKQLGPGQSETVEPGDTVVYTIRVFNQGQIAADSIALADYIPAGMNFDAGLNPEWTVNTAGDVAQTLLSAAEGEIPAGGLLPGDEVSVNIYLVIDAPLAAGFEFVNWAEITRATDEQGYETDDVDSQPDSNPDNDTYLQDDDINGDAVTGGDEDDHDPATVVVEVFDLALYKQLSPGQPMVVEPGDTVSFTIAVVNQGTIAADNIRLVDYVPAGMNFDGTLNPGWTVSLGKIITDLRVSEGDLPAGGLLPGQTATVTIQLILDSPLDPGISLTNWAEIVSATDDAGAPQQDDDSTPDNNGNNDLYLQDNYIDGDGQAGGDEDDHDPATVITEAFDLALVKLLSPGQEAVVAPGDTVSYAIQVINQGQIAADNIEITDYLPAQLLFDNALNPGWVFISGNRARTTLRVSEGELPAGGLAPGEALTVTLQLVLADPLPQGLQIVNWAEVSNATDDAGNPQDDIDSDPDGVNDDTYLQDNEVSGNGNDGEDEDDHDQATISTLSFDLALIKQLAPGQAYGVEPGDTVQFVITVFNQGTIPADNIVVTDYLPATLNFIAALNPDWSLSGGNPTTTLSVAQGELPVGGLAPNATVEVTITLVVDNPLPPGTQIVNTAEVTDATDQNGNSVVDMDSEPDAVNDDVLLQDNEISGDGLGGEDEDDHDVATVITQVFDLALIKTLEVGQLNTVGLNDTITFVIEVINQGMIAADNIQVTDYLPQGLLFFQTLNPGWSLVGGQPTTTLSVANGALASTGLLPGASVYAEINLVVAPDVAEGLELVNFAEISAATDTNGDPKQDIDSTPDSNGNNDTYVHDNDVNGNGTIGEDEDDHDPAQVEMECYRTAGVDTHIETCLGCSEAVVVVDFFGSLGGNPDTGGYWTDLDNSGLDLSNPSAVPVTDLAPGLYHFAYTISGINGCANRTAILELEVVSIENLVCNADINISLGENCVAEVGVDNLLEGDLPCYNALEVHIYTSSGFDLGNTVTEAVIGQTLTFKVEDPLCGNHCWGTIKIEDKRKPVITCPDDTDQAMVTEQVQTISGALSAGDPQLDLDDHYCFLNLTNPVNGPHYYDLYTFTVTESDVYTFDLNTGWGDGIVALYQGGFNADQPCANIIALGDDNLNGTFGIFDPFDPILRLSLPLEPGVQYVLLTTSFDINQTGDYSYTVYSDGDGLITGLPLTAQVAKRDLICTDIDHIYNNPLSAQYTGMATAVDNCTDPVTNITFTDLILSDDGDCGEVVIMRRFVATDESGNSAQCVQEITVRKATMDDVILPPYVVYVECDETFPTDQNGNPHPSLTGFPFLFTAFGIVELDDSYCNLGASYFDYPHAQVCEGTYEFRREWTVFNWCAPASTIIYNQIIKVGDFSAPEVFCPVEDYDWDGTADLLTYSTGPYDCTAVIEAPLPQVEDNCSGTQIVTEVVHIATVNVTNQYGQVTGTTQQAIVVATIADGASRIVANLEIGSYFFRYIVTDACNHQTVIECPFRVIDDIAPIAICDDDLHISIGGEGYAQVSADDIDEGSWDNCSPVRLEVRRSYAHNDDCDPVEPYFGSWSDIVDFGCCDINDSVTIELRVWEDADHDGLWGAWYGNPDLDGDGYPDVDTLDDKGNVCWLEVLIEDKLNPYCTAPHDVTITCDELPYDFPRETSQASQADTVLLQQLFGVALGSDNCPGAQVKELAPIWDLECGSGTIIRRFSVTDAVGNVSTNTCQQIITIQKIHNYEIKFPKDASANCGVPHPDTLEVHDQGCDLLAVSVEDEVFSASGDECYKIFRTYRIINWCEYNGTDDPIVVSRDEDCDANPGDEDIWVLVRQSGVGGQKVTYYDRNDDEGDNVPAPFVKNPSCDGRTNPAGYWMSSVPGSYGTTAITSRGYWEYTQVIKVYDNIQPVITAEATEPFCSYSSDIAEGCPGEVEIPFTVDENCTPDDLEITVLLDAFNDGVLDGDITAASLTGTYPDFVIVGNFPLGQHLFEVHVHDGCGNVNELDIPFEVVDCKAPTPICINGLTIELMPVVPISDVDGDGIADTGAMTIWASDFVSSAVEDCTGPVRYSIHIADEVTNGSNIPDTSQTSLILTCADPSTTIIRIYAWDSAYNPYSVQPDGTVGGPNFDFCETYVIIQDNMFDVCPDVVPGSGMIAGVIATPNDEVVEGVAVDLSGQAVMNYATALDGQFSFNNLQTGYDYTVTPQLDTDPLNGVSTFDIILITKHILTTQPLDNPYDMIAADANNSKTITVQDIILIRKLILTLEDNFPTNTSWRFVPATYEFPVPTNPWFEDFPEVINVNDLSGQLMGQDFVAIKIGDINSSALTTFAAIEERDIKGLYEIITNDIELKVGEEYEVQLRADQLTQIQGWQGTLLFDASVLEFKDINYGAIQPGHVGLRHVADGAITMSWNDPAGTNGSGVDQLTSLIFKAKQNARLSQVLGIGSRYTRAEAYNTKGELLNLGLQFRNQVEEPYALYQNMPNPFSKSTVIGFYLPEASNADLIIQSVDGKVIKRIEAEYAKGYHQVLLDASELSRGVMFYTLTTGNFSATRKMILVE